MDLSFSFCGSEYNSSAQLSSPSSIDFNFAPPAPGACNASLTASDGQVVLDEKNALSEVFAPPTVKISDVRSFMQGSNLTTLIAFESTGEPVSPVIIIEGETLPATASLDVNLAEGEHASMLEWPT